jgi:transketolase
VAIPNAPDWEAARRRCRGYRRRILAISQKVSALHVAPAFSCLEIVDAVYNILMRRLPDRKLADGFVMSKGHGVMAQYVILEDLGIMPSEALESYCTKHGVLGAHPDYGNPGIEASTGSLGHGLAIAAGMAYADRLQGRDRTTFVVLGDGEMQEGSIWEAIMMAPNLKLDNLVAFLDFNDYQGLGRTTETHPYFLPMSEKVASFGWEAIDVDGHDSEAVVEAVVNRRGERPLFLTCRTVKGRGVSYMIDAPIWHYRSPSKEEYAQALAELEAEAEEAAA